MEVDDSTHNGMDRMAQDAGRDRWLREQGVTAMRLAADQVVAYPDHAAEQVIERARRLVDRP